MVPASAPAGARHPPGPSRGGGGRHERAEALDQVRRWDLRYDPGSAGASIYEAWYWHFLGDVLVDELGPDVLKEYRIIGMSQIPSTIDLLSRPGDPLFDDKRTPAVEHRDDIVRRSLTEAVAWLAAHHGDDPAGWTYGKVHSVTLVHSTLGQSGIVPLERLFNSATYPAPGTAFTINAEVADVTKPFAVNFGSSQRMIVDLADLEGSTWVNSTGQDAQLFRPPTARIRSPSGPRSRTIR